MVSDKGQQQVGCKSDLRGATSELNSRDLEEKLDNRRERSQRVDEEKAG